MRIRESAHDQIAPQRPNKLGSFTPRLCDHRGNDNVWSDRYINLELRHCIPRERSAIWTRFLERNESSNRLKPRSARVHARSHLQALSHHQITLHPPILCDRLEFK